MSAAILYRRDRLAWAQDQAALLRRLARGGHVRQAIDFPNVILSVEEVGHGELRATQSLLATAMRCAIVAETLNDDEHAERLQADARVFLAQARRRLSPTMRAGLRLSELWADVRAALGDRAPATCPFSLHELLGSG